MGPFKRAGAEPTSLIKAVGKTAPELCNDWIYVNCAGEEAEVYNCKTDACLGDAAAGLGCLDKCFDIPKMEANKYCFFGEPLMLNPMYTRLKFLAFNNAKNHLEKLKLISLSENE